MKSSLSVPHNPVGDGVDVLDLDHARKPAISAEKLAGVSLAVRNIDHGFTLHGDYLPVLENVSFQVLRRRWKSARFSLV